MHETHRSMLDGLNDEITSCTKCPRLVAYLQDVAVKRVRRFSDQEYWARPLPGFGDANCRVLIVGLAPAAHGGNRTGRMFTGDSSADWLARVLYRHGFATKPRSRARNDGFALVDAYMTAAARCAPPQNKPTREELDSCSIYLRRELEILSCVRIIICLGRIAFEAVCRQLDVRYERFGHGRIFGHGRYTIICSYHPSRQNTNTGRLTWDAWDGIFRSARALVKRQKVTSHPRPSPDQRRNAVM